MRQSLPVFGAPEISWQQTERKSLEDFANDRARDFIGREAVIERVTSLCLSPAREDVFLSTKAGPPSGVCVTGEPGSGKSALFGELLRRLKDTDAFILAQAAGASQRASSIDAMLRRWIGELGSALGAGAVDLAENVDPAAVETAFASLLGRTASRQRVVVLIDSLGQFKETTRARSMTWLPRLWPANARFVATAIADGASQVLSERPRVEALPLPPLDATEARGIIERLCDRHHRTFEPPVIDALLAKRHADVPASGNPLWLVLAVHELNLLDADEFAGVQRDDTGASAERLRNLICDMVGAMPADVPGLYNAMLDRAAELAGATVAPALSGLIAVSRAGWRESDFRQMLPRASGEPWDERRFAALHRLFGDQMRQRDDLGQWDFAHAEMRAVARSRLTTLRLSEPQLHLLIADHLLTLAPSDPLRVTETMVHLLASKDVVRAAQYYGDPSLSDAEVRGATRALADRVIAPPAGTPANAARDICRLLDAPDKSVSPVVAERFLFSLDDGTEKHIPVDARFIILDSIERAFEQLLRTDPGNTGWQRDLAVSHDRVGDVLIAQGNLPAALKSFQDGLAIRERLAGADPANADRQRDLSVSYDRVGGVLMAQGDFPGALQSFRDALAIKERLASAGPGNADWQRGLSVGYDYVGEALMAQGDLSAALKPFRDGLAIRERLARADPGDADWQRSLSVSYDRVGDVLVAQGDLAGALESFRYGLAIRERLADADPDNPGWQRGLSVSYDREGDVLVAQGDLPAALKSFRDQLAIAERLASTDPSNAGLQRDLSVSHAKVGDVLIAQGNLPEALESFRDGLAVRERLARADPGNADWQRGLSVSYDRVGDVLMAQGDLGEALKSFSEQLAIANQLARADPGNTGLQRDLSVSFEKVGDVLEARGNLPEALKSFHAGLEIRERLASADPGNVIWQRSLSVSYDCVGDVLVAQGNLPEALKSFQVGLAIREQLARTNSGNADWQRDLSVSYERVGEVLEAQGNLSEALKSFHASLAIADRLARVNSGNADLQRGLAVSYAHLAEVYRRSDDADNALAMLRHGQTIMERVVKLWPDNDGWTKDLAWFNDQVATSTK